MVELKNGKGRDMKWAAIVPLLALLAGGAITWGETRVRLADSVADVKELETKHEGDIEKLTESQNEINSKLGDVRTEQRLIQQEMEHIKKSQERQEDTARQILRILKNE